MKKLILKEGIKRSIDCFAGDDMEKDVACIVDVMKAAGFEVSVEDAYEAWSEFSGTYAAGWLNVIGHKNHHIVEAVMPYLREVDTH